MVIVEGCLQPDHVVLVCCLKEKNCSSLRTMMEAGFQIVDVRTEAEFKENAVKSAVNLPLSHLNSLMDQLDK